jgi:histidine ammonia-lyase
MVTLDGNSLTIAQVGAVARGEESADIADAALDAMQRSRAVVERLAAGEAPRSIPASACWRMFRFRRLT